MFVTRSVNNILKEWRKEAKNKHLCLYKREGDTLIIYTDRPGYMIGRCGSLCKKYSDRICGASFGTIRNVNFVETYGIF